MVYVTETLYNNYTGKSVIYEFIRSPKGKKIINKISDFQAYFFVKEDSYVNDSRVIKEINGFTGLGNIKLKKCIVRDSGCIKEIKEKLLTENIDTWEADILYRNRYLIDTYKDIESVPLKAFSIDIETNSDTTFPDMHNPNQEITCIGIQDSFTDNKYNFVWRKDLVQEEMMLDDTKVFKFNTEESMLHSFTEFMNKESPDIITGWNVNSFDLYYLIGRMQVLEVDFTKLSPINKVRINEKYQDAEIKGIVIFDMLDYYKYFRRISNQTELVNYKLDTVGVEVLGKEKLKFEETLGNLWQTDIETLIRYNMRDVELVAEIDKKLKLINFFDTVRIMSNCQFEDIVKTTVMLDTYMMSEYPDIKLPTKKKHENNKFQGAYVGNPIPGLHKNIFCLDIKSMYPNIMKTFNISPETFDPINGEIRISETVAFKREEGMIPKILKTLGDTRQHYKNIKKESKKHSSKWYVAHYRQYAIKVIMNAFYGYLGAPQSRLYIKEVAETITRLGREIILWSNKVVEQNDFKVIYNDTDSIYATYKKELNNKLKVILKGEAIIKILNDSYKDFVKQFNLEEHTIEMEFEKALKVMLFTCDSKGQGTKKRYAYKKLWEEGKFVHNNHVNITGFDCIRSDVPEIAKVMQKEVLNKILDDTPQKEVFDYLLEIKNKIINNQIPVEELAFPVAFKEKLHKYGQVSPALKGAIYANRYLGANIETNSKYLWLPIKNAPRGMPQYIEVESLKRNAMTKEKETFKKTYLLNAITFDEDCPKEFKDVIDFSYLEDRLFKMKLENIFLAIGWNWEPITNTRQQTLF